MNKPRISFRPGGAYVKRVNILRPGDDTRVYIANCPSGWACPIHLYIEERQADFVADVFDETDQGAMSKGIVLSDLLTCAAQSSSPGMIVNVVRLFAPCETKGILNAIVSSR
jgi:hypothetical protein